MMPEAHNDRATRETMQGLAHAVTQFLYGMSVDGKVPAFTVLVWPSGEPGNRVNYVSNVPRHDRDQIRNAMAAVQARWNAEDHRKE